MSIELSNRGRDFLVVVSYLTQASFGVIELLGGFPLETFVEFDSLLVGIQDFFFCLVAPCCKFHIQVGAGTICCRFELFFLFLVKNPKFGCFLCDFALHGGFRESGLFLNFSQRQLVCCALDFNIALQFGAKPFCFTQFTVSDNFLFRNLTFCFSA